RVSLAVLLLPAAAACDDAPKPGAPGASAAPAATTAAHTAATAATPAPAPAANPELLVDAEGPYLAGTRVDLAAAGGKEKLTRIIGSLPKKAEPQTLIVDKKAKVPVVATVVAELGAAGTPRVVIKTNGRGDLPKEVTFTPEGRVSSPPGCSVTAMVLKDLSTAVWPIKGGTGKRQRKGFAGPDLSHTSEALTKDLGACDSKVAFVSADDNVPWEDAFNLAGTVLKSDEKKHLDTLVLLKEAPVAGRPVALSK
ncbi:MAG TPA: biopolymer transporter ExbD, partial [Minicystis sp.]|nr:biopolymer transporter ExbD [Minicystis sp.]